MALTMALTDAPDSQAAAKGEGSKTAPLPLLRWAGGKRWLAPKVIELLGSRAVDRYHEPFFGGGSVFFSLQVVGEARLSDLNAELIEVYEQVKQNPRAVAESLGSFENTSDCYYTARAARPSEAVDRAARFIFLNHTSFNGIHRVNLKGEYNVPFGNRKSVRIPDESQLLAASSMFRNAHFSSADFGESLSTVSAGDLVFLDPPYTVAHNNNGFVKYNQHLFSYEDQVRLAVEVQRISSIGARFVLTNAAHESIDELFSELGEKFVVRRKNTVGGRESLRGQAEEYMFTNIGAS